MSRARLYSKFDNAPREHSGLNPSPMLNATGCTGWSPQPELYLQVDLGDVEEAVLWYGDELDVAVDTHRSFDDLRCAPSAGASAGMPHGNEIEIISFGT